MSAPAATTAPLPVVPTTGPGVPVVALGPPRLTASFRPDGRPTSLAVHRRRHGAPPTPVSGELTALVTAGGVRGRGGAGFPLGRKLAVALRSAASGARDEAPDVVVNAAESEPASHKDRVLLTRAPHLVLDGARLLAAELGARTVRVWVHDQHSAAVLRAAAARRVDDPVPAQVVQAPDGYLAGESSAALRALAGGPAVPGFALAPAARRGPGGRPVLVANAETVAAVALAVGAGSADGGGRGEQPTLLLTVHRGPGEPVVVEVPSGTPVRAALAAAGGPRERVRAVLLGGYGGRWLRGRDGLETPLSHTAGPGPGPGIVLPVPQAACVLREVAEVVAALADQRAGQCGPCDHGLPALATATADLAACRADTATVRRIVRLAGLVTGRGACGLPDGVARFAATALTALPREVADHLAGHCPRPYRRLLPPVPVP